MRKLNLDLSNVEKFLNQEILEATKEDVKKAYHTLVSKSGAGNDYVGWLDLPLDYDKEEFYRIQKAALKIKTQSQVLLAIGIGGSYLGAKSAIEMLNGYFQKGGVEVIFVGNHISSSYASELIENIVKENEPKPWIWKERNSSFKNLVLTAENLERLVKERITRKTSVTQIKIRLIKCIVLTVEQKFLVWNSPVCLMDVCVVIPVAKPS